MCSNCMNNCGGSCSSSRNTCQNLGPFTAVDVACITTPTPTATGSIIPFSSGVTPVVLATLLGGVVGVPSLIGFGTAIPGVAILGNQIDLSGLITEAFSVPRAGNITAISASFTSTLGVTLLGSTTVQATVFQAPAGSSIFTATTATVNLAPPFTGVLVGGETAFATATVGPIPVAAGDRLLMVYTIATEGITVAQVLTGTASAGITIA